jgi:hypothetical protein
MSILLYFAIPICNGLFVALINNDKNATAMASLLLGMMGYVFPYIDLRYTESGHPELHKYTTLQFFFLNSGYALLFGMLALAACTGLQSIKDFFRRPVDPR